MSLLLKYNDAVHLSPVLPALPISLRYFSIVVGGLQCIILVIHQASKPITSATVANTKRNVGFSFFSSVMAWCFYSVRVIFMELIKYSVFWYMFTVIFSFISDFTYC